MAKAFEKKIGRTMTWTNGTEADVEVNDVVVVGDRIGIATTDIPKGGTGELAMEGVYEFPAENNETISCGDAVYWDASTGKITKTATNNKRAGTAHADKATAGTTVWVKID